MPNPFNIFTQVVNFFVDNAVLRKWWKAFQKRYYYKFVSQKQQQIKNTNRHYSLFFFKPSKSQDCPFSCSELCQREYRIGVHKEVSSAKKTMYKPPIYEKTIKDSAEHLHSLFTNRRSNDYPQISSSYLHLECYHLFFAIMSSFVVLSL